MSSELLNFNIVFILTIGFAYASIFGYLAMKAGFPSFLGYIIAGFIIGPFSPGFVADLKTAEQLADIGVILMMFGVGLEFKSEDLIKVKKIAIVGGIGQTSIAGVAIALIVYAMGWSFESSLVFGLCVGVASTVVLIKILTENKLLNTPQGHIAIGWLLVEDLIVIIALILAPTFFLTKGNQGISFSELASSLGILSLKLLTLGLVVFYFGRKVVSYLLSKVTETRSHELFTITILALIFVVATGSSLLFGVSLALGAFIAGMVIGKTEKRRKAVLHSIHLKDTFVVIFFLSMGMLFNPAVIHEHPLLFLSTLAVILIIKPISAFLLSKSLKMSHEVALTVALGLAQIGELSFILAEEGMKYNVIPDEGFDALVACSLISIAINPILFKKFLKSEQANNFFLI